MKNTLLVFVEPVSGEADPSLGSAVPDATRGYRFIRSRTRRGDRSKQRIFCDFNARTTRHDMGTGRRLTPGATPLSPPPPPFRKHVSRGDLRLFGEGAAADCSHVGLIHQCQRRDCGAQTCPHARRNVGDHTHERGSETTGFISHQPI